MIIKVTSITPREGKAGAYWTVQTMDQVYSCFEFDIASKIIAGKAYDVDIVTKGNYKNIVGFKPPLQGTSKPVYAPTARVETKNDITPIDTRIMRGNAINALGSLRSGSSMSLNDFLKEATGVADWLNTGKLSTNEPIAEEDFGEEVTPEDIDDLPYLFDPF
jgi:hypothetical protein